jgi:alkanesulfonate monooxygenase SsuD/methylene tetrahydromethanopterin reductase-like flavin-dependent oxidoreductase (luciferase family)
MKTGINIRVMGDQSSRETIARILQLAEESGVESAWIVDHIAIPPDDAEGSGGRYLDLITTLAWMAGQTQSIMIGASVLILPYRPMLPTAKSIATIQELSEGRLLLGVGIGGMQPEFNALGIPRERRGKISDEMLAFIHECFSNDEVVLNGQPFLFRPRPERPPIYVGGAAPHALDRAIRFGDGWLPMGRLEKLIPDIDIYKRRSLEETGKPGEVVTFASIQDLTEADAALLLKRYEDAGVDRVILGQSYQKAEDWIPTLHLLEKVNHRQ